MTAVLLVIYMAALVLMVRHMHLKAVDASLDAIDAAYERECTEAYGGEHFIPVLEAIRRERWIVRSMIMFRASRTA